MHVKYMYTLSLLVFSTKNDNISNNQELRRTHDLHSVCQVLTLYLSVYA